MQRLVRESPLNGFDTISLFLVAARVDLDDFFASGILRQRRNAE